MKVMAGGDSKYVFIFTDESYVNINHTAKNAYGKAGQSMKKKTGKRKRLIILHDIGEDGPLMDRDENNVPIDDLEWPGDTPHPEVRRDGKVTTELLWVAQSHTGDYHDNICSDMFMKWVEEKLVPTFDKKYPRKKDLDSR